MIETDDTWDESSWVERDATGRTRSGVRAAVRSAPAVRRERAPASALTSSAFGPEEEETWIGYAFRKLSRYAFVAPRQPRS
jgi:hypothetical protein